MPLQAINTTCNIFMQHIYVTCHLVFTALHNSVFAESSLILFHLGMNPINNDDFPYKLLQSSIENDNLGLANDDANIKKPGNLNSFFISIHDRSDTSFELFHSIWLEILFKRKSVELMILCTL